MDATPERFLRFLASIFPHCSQNPLRAWVSRIEDLDRRLPQLQGLKGLSVRIQVVAQVAPRPHGQYLPRNNFPVRTLGLRQSLSEANAPPQRLNDFQLVGEEVLLITIDLGNLDPARND